MADRVRARSHDEQGMTLIEIMTVMVIAATVLTVGGMALRHFWLVRSLHGGGDKVLTQMRYTQEKVVSESYPLVYGLRFKLNSNEWWAVRFDPKNAGTGDDTCVATEKYRLESGVTIKAASFTSDAIVTARCRTSLGAGATDAFVFFYPRGNATAGSLTLQHLTLGRQVTVTVDAITGRVSKS